MATRSEILWTTWWATVHRVKKSQTQLNDYHFHFFHDLNKHRSLLAERIITESGFLALGRGRKAEGAATYYRQLSSYIHGD